MNNPYLLRSSRAAALSVLLGVILIYRCQDPPLPSTPKPAPYLFLSHGPLDLNFVPTVTLTRALLAGTNTFTVADPKLKVLEDSCFCSNGRIICHEDGLTVEVRVSKVIPDDVMDVPEDYNEINQ